MSHYKILNFSYLYIQSLPSMNKKGLEGNCQKTPLVESIGSSTISLNTILTYSCSKPSQIMVPSCTYSKIGYNMSRPI